MNVSAVRTASVWQAPVHRACPPDPATGSEPIDLTDIDTSRDAVQLPILDPAFQMGLAMGVLSSLMSGSPEARPGVGLSVVSEQGGTVISADYRLNLNSAENAVVGQGTIGELPLTESARLEEGRVIWEGRVGDQTQQLSLEVGEDEQSVAIRGTLGRVDTNLEITPINAPDGNFAGIRTEGMLDGERYLVDAMVDMPGAILAGKNEGSMVVRGHMNGHVVEKDYRVRVEADGNGFTIRADGAGLNAGVPQNVGVAIRVDSNPAAGPARPA